MRFMDFTTWQGVLTTLLGILLVTLIGVGIRVVTMLTIQQRQQRMNRQINERLKTLIAAYKVLGGSITGNLEVSPLHLKDLRETGAEEGRETASDRKRRIRDAVEAALSDILLLGTEEQVRQAAAVAADMAAGRPVQTAELVVSLRDYIRRALDLEPVPAELAMPRQGPSRPSGSGGRSGRGDEGGRGGGQGGQGDMGGSGTGMGIGMGAGRNDPDV